MQKPIYISSTHVDRLANYSFGCTFHRIRAFRRVSKSFFEIFIPCDAEKTTFRIKYHRDHSRFFPPWYNSSPPKSEQVCRKEISAILTSAVTSPRFGKDTTGWESGEGLFYVYRWRKTFQGLAKLGHRARCFHIVAAARYVVLQCAA